MYVGATGVNEETLVVGPPAQLPHGADPNCPPGPSSISCPLDSLNNKIKIFLSH